MSYKIIDLHKALGNTFVILKYMRGDILISLKIMKWNSNKNYEFYMNVYNMLKIKTHNVISKISRF